MVELGIVNQAQLDSLMQYRDDCRASAVTIASPPHFHFRWFSEEYNWFRSDVEHGNGCNRGGNMFIGDVSGKIMMRYWWREYLYEARRRLEERPWGSMVTSGDFFDKAFKEGSQCYVCRQDDFKKFSDLFACEINKAVSQARYRISLTSGNATNFSVGCTHIVHELREGSNSSRSHCGRVREQGRICRSGRCRGITQLGRIGMCLGFSLYMNRFRLHLSALLQTRDSEMILVAGLRRSLSIIHIRSL
jgi:hypothetical protein